MNRILTIVLPEDAKGNMAFLSSQAYRACGETTTALVTTIQTQLKELGFDATVGAFDDPAKTPALTLIPKEYCDTLRAAITAKGYDASKALDCELAGALSTYLFAETFVEGRTKEQALDDLEDHAEAIAERGVTILAPPA